jgi:hypothetical protein
MEDSNFATGVSSEDHSDFIGPRRPSGADVQSAIDAGQSTDEMLEVPAAPTGPELSKKAFDSYMILEDDLKVGDHRLLEVDNKLVLPS